MTWLQTVYLIDTNVISEARKGARGDAGVRRFFQTARQRQQRLFLSVVTVGELRRGINLIRHRGDIPQAQQLETWLLDVLAEFDDWILDIDADIAQAWGALRSPHPEHALDKLIAATALIHDLCVVTRNVRDFEPTGAEVFNPFSG